VQRTPSRTRAAGAGIAPWLALAICFSPTLFDLARNLARDPGDRATLLTPLLLALLWRSRPGPARRPGWALLLATTGAALEVLGIATGTSTFGRLGLPIAIIGLALWTGAPAVSVAALSFFLVPLPDTMTLAATPWLESLWGRLAVGAFRALGASVSVIGPLLHGTAGVLELRPADGGTPLAATLASLGWFAALRLGESAGTACVRAVAFAAAAPLVQLAAVALAVAALVAGVPGLGRFGLTYFPWLAAAAATLAYTEPRRGSRTVGRPLPSLSG